MANYSYRFVYLNDSDPTVNQSRGINLQFNGYVPVTCKSATYLSNLISQKKVPDIKKAAIDSDDMVLLFRDVRYKSNGSNETKPDDSHYKDYTKKPGNHMFQGLTVMGADELQIVDENGSERSTLSIEVPLYDTMFGDRLTNGKARIDGVIFYGQAYNPMFNDQYRQGDLERVVPIAMIVFAPSGSGDKPYIDPNGSSKVMTQLRIGLNVAYGDSAGDQVIESEIFKDWKKITGSIHTVNDGMGTSADFIVRGHEIDIAPISEDFAISGDKTINVATRMFFTNDPEGSNNDLNVDFGSPARLNVMNYDEVSDGKKPQMMISKVKNWTDTNGYKHASWDGVVESWYSESANNTYSDAYPYPKSVSGSFYDIDYVALGAPAISIFSEDVKPTIWGNSTGIMQEYSPYSMGYPSHETEYTQMNNPGLHERYDKAFIFADGISLFSKNTQIANQTLALSSENVRSRGKNVILGSYGVGISTKDDYDTINRDRVYKSFVANSQSIDICDQEEVPDFGKVTSPEGNTGWGAHPFSRRTYSHTTVLGSESVQVFNWGEAFDYFDSNPNPYWWQARNFIASSRYLRMLLSDNNVVLGIKGTTDYIKTQNVYGDGPQNLMGGPSDYNEDPTTHVCYYETGNSTIYRAYDSVFLNGQVHVRDVKGVLVLGAGCSHSTQYGANIVEGFRHFDTSSGNQTSHSYHVENSAILGLDNRISCIFPATKGWRHWCKGRVSHVYEIGKSLTNDVRQQYWIEDQWCHIPGEIGNNANIEREPATVILGSRNAYYAQKGKWAKQVIIGGFKTKGIKGAKTSDVIPWWNYNSFEFKSEWVAPSRNAMAVQDMKGRQIMYTSLGVNLGFMKGKRDAEAYEKYKYSDMGNINFFKLYRLLEHLTYDWDTGLVRFNIGKIDGDQGKATSSQPVGFHNVAMVNGSPSSCFADLVDERRCYQPYCPMGDSNTDGGGAYYVAPGGGDAYDWASSSNSSSS